MRSSPNQAEPSGIIVARSARLEFGVHSGGTDPAYMSVVEADVLHQPIPTTDQQHPAMVLHDAAR